MNIHTCLTDGHEKTNRLIFQEQWKDIKVQGQRCLIRKTGPEKTSDSAKVCYIKWETNGKPTFLDFVNFASHENSSLGIKPDNMFHPVIDEWLNMVKQLNHCAGLVLVLIISPSLLVTSCIPIDG